jgi:alkylation response protein AidB-like acyl-CoA dehydrogenase
MEARTFKRSAIAIAVAGAFAVGAFTADRVSMHSAQAASPPSAAPVAVVSGAPLVALPDFSVLVEKYGPTVVNISVTADGSKRAGPDGKPISYTVFFRKSSAVVRDTWQVMGLRGTGSDSYMVTDLFVPEAYTMARDGSAKPRVKGELYVFTPSTLYASCFAGIALGIARSVMTSFVNEASGTVPRGGSRSRAENNVMQAHVGLNEARLRAARTFLLTSVAEIWEAARIRGELTQDELITIRMASTFAIQTAREVVATLYAAAGAMAIFNARPFERRFRDIHTVTQQIQGHPEHFETVGQVLLGRKPDRPLFTF